MLQSPEMFKFIAQNCGDGPLSTHDACRNALEAAIVLGQMDLIEMFVQEMGVNVNKPFPLSKGERRCSNFLATAICYKEPVISEYLIERGGADVGVPPHHRGFGSLLALAAGTLDLATASLLLRHGAKANLRLRTGNYGSALAAAANVDSSSLRFSTGRRIEVVKLFARSRGRCQCIAFTRRIRQCACCCSCCCKRDCSR